MLAWGFDDQPGKLDRFDDPFVHAGLGLEGRAEISAERTGLDLEVVLEQFRELDRHRPFDDPKERRTAEIVVLFYERDPTARSREATDASVAKASRVTVREARRRVDEVEGLIGLSIDIPIHWAILDLAFTLYELHGDELPPPGDPWWSQGRKRRPSGDG